jgi:hypothetical protein
MTDLMDWQDFVDWTEFLRDKYGIPYPVTADDADED